MMIETQKDLLCRMYCRDKGHYTFGMLVNVWCNALKGNGKFSTKNYAVQELNT
ncbi:hypothetical protein GQ44DRAFT_712719 [Phaeosphaeriaceae sp. PMI808]|nr:hypothetical protein GQ44DRAFT_712719 [Phaeosphaeriaceae sp. PMI808]